MSSTPSSLFGSHTSREALRRLQERSGGPKFRDSATRLPLIEQAAERDAQPALNARIGHTVIPEKHEVVCYECDYLFSLAGHMHDTVCPKCHRQLRLDDYVIDKEWTEPVKTIGTVRVHKEGRVVSTTVFGRDVFLAGQVKDTRVRATRKLSLAATADVDFEALSMRDLTIEEGSSFAAPRKLICRHLDIAGNFTATVYVDDIAIVRAGATFRGELHSPRLVVEEGGGIHAKLVVGL